MVVIMVTAVLRRPWIELRCRQCVGADEYVDLEDVVPDCGVTEEEVILLVLCDSVGCDSCLSVVRSRFESVCIVLRGRGVPGWALP